VLVLRSQVPGLVEQYGLTRAQTDRALWAVDSTGSTFSGAGAVNRVLAELGGPWPPLARAYRFALIRWAEDRAYGWVADHRSRLWFWTTTPECDQPDARCE
jgi:predicted DCC family thiol-disulfide oxidoreductase YuxK